MPEPQPSNSKENPITTTDCDPCGQWCKCHRCGYVSICTPANDYYSINKLADGFLYCKGCFTAITGAVV